MLLIRSILEALELDSKLEKAVIPDSSFSGLALMFPYRGGVTSLFVFFSRNTVSSDIHGVYMVTMMTVELVVTMCFIVSFVELITTCPILKQARRPLEHKRFILTRI